MSSSFCRIVLIFLLLTLILGGGGGVLAGDWSFSASSSASSLYVWRGIRFSPGFVQQTQGSVTYKGFNANVWSNYDYCQEKLNEIDVTLSYSRDVGNFTLGAGWNHFGMFDGLDSDEIYFSAAFNAWPVTPAVTAYFDVNAGKGAYVQASLSREQTLTPLVSLNLTANVGIIVNDGYMGRNAAGEKFVNFFNADLTAALPIKLGSYFVLEPKVGVAFPLSDDAKFAIENYGCGSYATTCYGMLTLTASF